MDKYTIEELEQGIEYKIVSEHKEEYLNLIYFRR